MMNVNNKADNTVSNYKFIDKFNLQEMSQGFPKGFLMFV